MIRVLVVDDSAIVRKVLTEELSKFQDVDVVGSAADPFMARDKIVKLNPDVITLDLEMPRMDGLSFLAKLMQHHPIPVVIVSSLTPEHSATAIRAMELGAIDVVSKPGSQYSVPDVSRKLIQAIRAAACAKMPRKPIVVQSNKEPAPTAISLRTTNQVIVIGASTGGTLALESVLSRLPADCPPIVMCQHMPEGFTKTFADRLNTVCPMCVREAQDGDHVVPGLALLAPGNRHMVLRRSGAQYLVRLKDGPLVHYQRPAVDVLFQSAAQSAGKNAIGVILTGMGADGAAGLLDMKKAGAATIAQNEESCIVFGMPKEAIKVGGVDRILHLDDIPAAILTEVSAKE